MKHLLPLTTLLTLLLTLSCGVLRREAPRHNTPETLTFGSSEELARYLESEPWTFSLRNIPTVDIRLNTFYGYGLDVRNDSVYSYLPFFGRAYQASMSNRSHYDFKAPIKSMEVKKTSDRQVTVILKANNETNQVRYVLDCFLNGRVSAWISSNHTQGLTYMGELVEPSEER